MKLAAKSKAVARPPPPPKPKLKSATVVGETTVVVVPAQPVKPKAIVPSKKVSVAKKAVAVKKAVESLSSVFVELSDDEAKTLLSDVASTDTVKVSAKTSASGRPSPTPSVLSTTSSAPSLLPTSTSSFSHIGTGSSLTPLTSSGVISISTSSSSLSSTPPLILASSTTSSFSSSSSQTTPLLLAGSSSASSSSASSSTSSTPSPITSTSSSSSSSSVPLQIALPTGPILLASAGKVSSQKTKKKKTKTGSDKGKGQTKKKSKTKVRLTLNESQRMWAVLTKCQTALLAKDLPMVMTRTLRFETDMRRLMGELVAYTNATVTGAPCGDCVLCDSKNTKSMLKSRSRYLNCDVDRNAVHYVVMDPNHSWYGAIVTFAPNQNLSVQVQFDTVGGRQRKSKRSVPFRYLRERGTRLSTYTKLAELVDGQAKTLAKATSIVKTAKITKIAKYNSFSDDLKWAAANASEQPVTNYPFYISNGVDLGIPASISSIQMRVHVIGICVAAQPGKVMLTNKMVRAARAIAAEEAGEKLVRGAHMDDIEEGDYGADGDDEYRVSLYAKDVYLEAREFAITSFAALQVWTPASHAQLTAVSYQVQLLEKAHLNPSKSSSSSSSSSGLSLSSSSSQGKKRGRGMADSDDSDDDSPIDVEVDEGDDGDDEKKVGGGGGGGGAKSKTMRHKKPKSTRSSVKSRTRSGAKRDMKGKTKKRRGGLTATSAAPLETVVVVVDDVDEDEEAIEASVIRRMVADVTVLEYGEDDTVRMQYEDPGVGNGLGWSACTIVAAATIAKSWPPIQPITINSTHVYRAYECGPDTPHAIVLPGSSRAYLVVQSNTDTVRQRLVRLDPRSTHALAMQMPPPPPPPVPISTPSVVPPPPPPPLPPSSSSSLSSSAVSFSSQSSSAPPLLSPLPPTSSSFAAVSSASFSALLYSTLPTSASTQTLTQVPAGMSTTSVSLSSSSPAPLPSSINALSSQSLSSTSTSALPMSTLPSALSASPSTSSSSPAPTVTTPLSSVLVGPIGGSTTDSKSDDQESKTAVKTVVTKRVRAPLTVPPPPGSVLPWQLDIHGLGQSLAQALKLPRIRSLQPHNRLRSAVPLQTVYALLRPTMPAQVMDVDALLQSMSSMDGGGGGGGGSSGSGLASKYTRTQRVPLKLDSDNPVHRAMARFVSHHFLATLGLPRQGTSSTYDFKSVSVCIDSIEALYSMPAEYQYHTHLQRLRTAHKERGHTWTGAVERYSYHGTAAHFVQSIIEGGFKAEFNVANAYGYGNYTAVHASYSHDYARVATTVTTANTNTKNRRHMFLCRTLVNGVRQTTSSDLRPGTGVVAGSNPNAIWLAAGGGLPPYPTIVGADSAPDPHIYVMAENDSVLPQFLITYHDVV